MKLLDRKPGKYCTLKDSNDEECGEPMFEASGVFICRKCDEITPEMIAANKK